MKEFEIDIILSRNIFSELINKKVFYQKGIYDSIQFEANRIKISGTRAKSIDIRNALFTSNSTHMHAVTVSLLYAYLIKSHFDVKSIEVSANINGGQNQFLLVEDQIEQRFSRKVDDSFLFQDSDLEDLFGNVPLSRKLTISLSYLIVALGFENKSDSFDNLWKSFNGLAKLATNEKKDSDILRALRVMIDNFPEKFNQSLTFSDGVSLDDLNKRHISEFIRSEYTGGSEANNYTKLEKSLLRTFEDSRVCTIMLEWMNCKSTILEKFDSKGSIKNELLQKISNEKVVNVDITRLLVLKYAYYLRCKYFHGEKKPHNFIVSNIESDELEAMYYPLKCIIYDLVQSKLYK